MAAGDRSTYPLGAAEMLLRLLRNRNIAPYGPKALYCIGGGMSGCVG